MAYPILKRVLGPVVSFYIKKMAGSENIPKKGAYLISANHASYMDHLMLGLILARKRNTVIHFLAKKEHFEGKQKYWHKYIKAIPIDRQAGGKEALQKAVAALKKGKVIGIYPEGTRTLTGKLNRGKTGAIRLALQAKVPILPIGITNNFKILPKGRNIPRFKRTDINIGKLMYFDEYYGKENDPKVLRMLTTKLMKEIARLAGKKYGFD